MPTLTKTLADFTIRSTWASTQPSITSTGTAKKSFDQSSILDGSTVTAATLSGTIQSQMWGGTFKAEADDISDSAKTLGTVIDNDDHTFSINVKSWFDSMTSLGGNDGVVYESFPVVFSYKAKGKSGYTQEYGYFKSVKLSITYTLPYSACTAPTTVKLSVTNPQRGQKTTLSWSGAKAGTNNAITGYEVYRSTTTKTGAYSKQTSTSSTSYSITAPNSDVTYFYKVKTLGTVSGYDSGLSSAIATMSMTTTACTAPTTITVSTAKPEPDASVKISWSGAKAGTNNAISGYELYRATSSSGTYSKIYTSSSTSTSGSYTDDVPQSGSRYYKVVTVGDYINSGYSSATSFTVTRTNTSDFTVPATTEVGTAIDITISDNTSRPHVLQWAITNGPSGSVNISAGTGTYSLAMPLSNLNSMTTATSFTITYELETQTTGGSKIGMVRKTGTITVPENVKPTVTAPTATPYSENNKVPSSWNVYVAGYSQANLSLSTAATKAYNASITKYAFSGNGCSETSTTAPSSSSPFTDTSDVLTSGTKSFTVTVTDTRGRKGTATTTVTVLDYVMPKILTRSAVRCNAQGGADEEGTYILVKATASVSSCDGHNTSTIRCYYRTSGDTSWTSGGTITTGQLVIGGGNILTSSNYDVRVTVTDGLSNVTTQDMMTVVPRSIWEFHVKRGGGAWAFGGPADLDGKLHVYGGVQADGPFTSTYDGTGMGFNTIAPSGAIGYLAKNSTTEKSVSMQVGSGGSNRGVYDSSGDKWMIYCDSSDRLRFSGANATTRSDLGISSLIDSDGSASATWLSDADTYLSTSTRVMQFYRRGNMILFRVNISLLAKQINLTQLGTIPSGYRPTTTIYAACPVPNTDNTCQMSLTSAGAINIAHYGDPIKSGSMRLTGCYPL